jgi:fumarate hydratase class II
VHPNDDVNLGQSSNDVFPHRHAHRCRCSCVPGAAEAALAGCARTAAKAAAFADVIKVGRTHLQDATPVTLGQEFGGYDAQLAWRRHAALAHTLPAVHALAIGGTAVGTGLNTHPEFGARVAAVLARRLDEPFVTVAQPVCRPGRARAAGGPALSARMLAVALIKIAATTSA